MYNLKVQFVSKYPISFKIRHQQNQTKPKCFKNKIHFFTRKDSKFVITTGHSRDWQKAVKSEVFDLSMSGIYHCADWVDFPIPLEGAVAAFLKTSIVVCGGRSFGQLDFSDCYR